MEYGTYPVIYGIRHWCLSSSLDVPNVLPYVRASCNRAIDLSPFVELSIASLLDVRLVNVIARTF